MDWFGKFKSQFIGLDMTSTFIMAIILLCGAIVFLSAIRFLKNVSTLSKALSGATEIKKTGRICIVASGK